MGYQLAYFSVRTVVWLLAASFLAIKVGSATQVHRTHLSYMIAGITGMFALRDLCELLVVTPIFEYFAIVLSQLSEASFMGLLLFISGGYGITLGKIKELPQYCFVLPSVFFLASVVFKFLLEYTRNATDATQISEWEQVVALVSGLVQAVIAVMSWMSVLESSEKVAKTLEQMAPRTAADRESVPTNHFQLSPDEEDNDGFQAVQPEVTTVAEEVDRMSKADLMRKFKIAVTIYMFAFVAAFFIPVYDSTGNNTNAALIIVILWNSILLGLLLCLAWVFRPHEEENPYLFVGEDEAANVHLDTRIEMTGGMPAIQEMPDEDSESAQTSPVRAGNSPNKVTYAAPQLSGATNGTDASNGAKPDEPSADPKASKFSLADGEDPKLE